MGIGASLVEEFAHAGASVVFTHNTHSERATALVERLRAQHPSAVLDTVCVDLSDVEATACSVQRAAELLGSRIHIGTSTSVYAASVPSARSDVIKFQALN